MRFRQNATIKIMEADARRGCLQDRGQVESEAEVGFEVKDWVRLMPRPRPRLMARRG